MVCHFLCFQIVAPLVKVGDLHSQSNSKSYFYVFEYQSKISDYQQVRKLGLLSRIEFCPETGVVPKLEQGFEIFDPNSITSARFLLIYTRKLVINYGNQLGFISISNAEGTRLSGPYLRFRLSSKLISLFMTP